MNGWRFYGRRLHAYTYFVQMNLSSSMKLGIGGESVVVVSIGGDVDG